MDPSLDHLREYARPWTLNTLYYNLVSCMEQTGKLGKKKLDWKISKTNKQKSAALDLTIYNHDNWLSFNNPWNYAFNAKRYLSAVGTQ